MKKLLIIIAFTVSALVTQAQIADSINWQRIDENMYCFSGDNGNWFVTHNGESNTGDVLLKSGAVISSKGKITWKDHSQSQLSIGYCVGENGAIYSSGYENKLQKSKAVVITH